MKIPHFPISRLLVADNPTSQTDRKVCNESKTNVGLLLNNVVRCSYFNVPSISNKLAVDANLKSALNSDIYFIVLERQ